MSQGHTSITRIITERRDARTARRTEPDMIRLVSHRGALHPVAAAAANDVLAELDARLPGSVAAFFITGAAALDDFQPGHSNLDFVAVINGNSTAAEVAALAACHDTMRLSDSPPMLDGIYLNAADYERGLPACPDGPHVRRGLFAVNGPYRRSAIDGQMLAQHAVAVRASEIIGSPAWCDPATCITAAQSEVAEVWRPWLITQAGPAPSGLSPTDRVLEVCRLHYTLVNGGIVSKTGAGLYGRITFAPAWHRLIDEALRRRQTPAAPPLFADPAQSDAEAIAFVAMAIDDGMFG